MIRMEYNIEKLYNYIKNNDRDECEDRDLMFDYLNNERFRDVVNNTNITYEDYVNWMAFEDSINKKVSYETFAQIDSIVWEIEGFSALELVENK